MDLRSGYPLWLVKSGLPESYPKLEKDFRTDVAILGGGISGALTAHFLTDRNIDCAVIDGRTIGLGSTCASTALLQYQVDIPLSRLAQMIGKKQAIRAYTLCARSVDTLEKICRQVKYFGFERKKTLFYASYPRHEQLIRDEYSIHKEAGFRVQYWNETLIKKRFGFTSSAALYSDHSAHIDAYLLTHALLRYNHEKGLKIFDRTFVEEINHGKKGVVLKTRNGFTIRARKLIYATGYESTRYIKKKIVDLSSTYAVASEHNTVKHQWYSDCLIWETKNPYLYMRTTGDKRIVVGGRDESFHDAKRRDEKIRTKSNQLRKDFGKLFPHVEFNPEFSWTGTFGSTKDGLPYIGEYADLPNSLFALGFGGNGITFSVIAAQIIADLLTGKKNRDSNLFSFNR